jgi:molecular chaperone DnaJ
VSASPQECATTSESAPAHREPGIHGGVWGDLYVAVHVDPGHVFERDGNDLTVIVPVSFPELALGTHWRYRHSRYGYA